MRNWNVAIARRYKQCLLTRHARNITQRKSNHCKKKNVLFKINKNCQASIIYLLRKYPETNILDGQSQFLDAIADIFLIRKTTSICYSLENLRFGCFCKLYGQPATLLKFKKNYAILVNFLYEYFSVRLKTLCLSYPNQQHGSQWRKKTGN